MKHVPVALALAAGFALTGCAGSVSAPTPIHSISAEEKASLHLVDVTSDAADGVEMGRTDFDLINEKIKAYIQTEAPGLLDASGNVANGTMKVHFTKFDRGNSFARFMLAGLGQIRIEATVFLVDRIGQQIGQYDVAKDFSLGGIYGGSTTVEDVENGFAKSVAEIVKTKA
jgi:hypothetical protein